MHHQGRALVSLLAFVLLSISSLPSSLSDVLKTWSRRRSLALPPLWFPIMLRIKSKLFTWLQSSYWAGLCTLQTGWPPVLLSALSPFLPLGLCCWLCASLLALGLDICPSAASSKCLSGFLYCSLLVLHSPYCYCPCLFFAGLLSVSPR